MLRLVFGLLALMPLQLWASDLIEQIREYDRQQCVYLLEIATHVMIAKQLGEEQDEEVVSLANSNLEIMEMLNNAQETPVFETEEEKLSAVNSFRKQVYANCLNHLSRY